MNTIKPPPAHRIIVAQLAVAFLTAAPFLIFSGIPSAWSALLGGLISAVANSYFVFQVFRYQGARNAEKAMRSFLHGETGKLGITLVLFALCFTLLNNLHEIALLTGFAVTYMTGIIKAGTLQVHNSRNN
ncbi:MAG: ATP synthase subunit I [Pseudohongiellaceae bacterium]